MSYATDYPAAQIAGLLGDRCVRELRRARPGAAGDTRMVLDRFVINPGALGYWLFAHFGLNIFSDADCARVTDVDPLAESLTVAGVGGGEFRIPHWCYLPTGLEPGDPRPATWPGIPREVEETPHP
jgi:hypothetical protein